MDYKQKMFAHQKFLIENVHSATLILLIRGTNMVLKSILGYHYGNS